MLAKEEYLGMSVEEKRRWYKCSKNYTVLSAIPTWTELATQTEANVKSDHAVREDLNRKISTFQGDITSLEIDAIVNAANTGLAGGGGVDGAIHSAAGYDWLQGECRSLHGCATGSAVITGGYKLPAKYIIHTVGPVGEKPDLLRSCYNESLTLAMENNLRSIAFPCISTGVYRYPNKEAATVALSTVRQFLEQHGDRFDRVIFCLFMPVDVECYNKLLPVYFPIK